MTKTIQIMIDKRGIMTNGDVIKAMFNPYKICIYEFNVIIYMTERDYSEADYQMNYDRSWWKAPYKVESEDE